MSRLLCASIALWLITQSLYAQSPPSVYAVPPSWEVPSPDQSIEPPSEVVPESPSLSPLTSYYVLPPSPPPNLSLDDEPLQLPPRTVVIQQLPPVVLTRTCWRDNYYAHSRRYYHGQTHCTRPE